MGSDRGIQAHGIVEPCLYMACSMRRRPVKITDAQGQGLCAALEIRAYRGGEQTELILIRRLDADNRT